MPDHSKLFSFSKSIIGSNRDSPIKKYCQQIINCETDNQSYLYGLILNEIRNDCLRHLESEHDVFKKSIEDVDTKERLILFNLLSKIKAEMDFLLTKAPSNADKDQLLQLRDKLTGNLEDYCADDAKKLYQSIGIVHPNIDPSTITERPINVEIFETWYIPDNFPGYIKSLKKQVDELYRITSKAAQVFVRFGKKITGEDLKNICGYPEGSGSDSLNSNNLNLLDCYAMTDLELVESLRISPYGYPAAIVLGTNDSCKLLPITYDSKVSIKNSESQLLTKSLDPSFEKIIYFANIRYCHAIFIKNVTKNEIYATHVSPASLMNYRYGVHPGETRKDTFNDILEFLAGNESDNLSVLIVEGIGCESKNGEALIEHVKTRLAAYPQAMVNYLKVNHEVYGDQGFNVIVYPDKNIMFVGLRYKVSAVKLDLNVAMQGNNHRYIVREESDMQNQLAFFENNNNAPKNTAY